MNGKTVPQEKVDTIIEAARLAPTSVGLQPFKILQITNRELREKIQPIANGQTQITDGSHLLVWAAWDSYSPERIGNVLLYNFRERGMPESGAEEYTKALWGMYEPLGQERQHHHATKQAYISLGMAIAAAAELKVDATPMEGFDNNALDELLDLRSQGLKSVVLLPLGYRDEANDWSVNLKKSRLPKEDLVIDIL